MNDECQVPDEVRNAGDSTARLSPAGAKENTNDEATILWDVVEEHLDDAEFLWSQWEKNLVAADYTLDEVASRTEERLLANLDGLAVGGGLVATKLLVPELEGDDRARVGSAAAALVASPRNDAAIVTALREGAMSSVVARAIALSNRHDAAAILRAALDAPSPHARASAIEGLAFLRIDPTRDAVSISADADPALVVAALRAARVSADAIHKPFVTESLASKSREIELEAMITGLVLGLPAAWSQCRGGPPAEVSALLLAMGGDPIDLRNLIPSLAVPEQRRAALWALGFSGRATAADACLPHLEDPEVGHIAGEAFAAITGLPLRDFTREIERAERSEPGPLASDNLDKSAPVPQPEDALPFLDFGRVSAWWSEQRSRFDPKGRYLYGAPYSLASVATVLERGPMRRRGPIALELEIRSRGRIHLETRAFSKRQISDLLQVKSASPAELDRSLSSAS